MSLRFRDITIYSFSQGQKKEHLIECEKYNSARLLLTLSKSNTILMESKPEVQKPLSRSKSREGTDESSEAIRFTNTFV